ncbi:MAG TPA: hypothetical protein VIZ69_10980 [Thermoanaerobaculia bacterium]
MPVALAGAPRPGWVALAWGTVRPAGWTVLRELPGGALLAPLGSATP